MWLCTASVLGGEGGAPSFTAADLLLTALLVWAAQLGWLPTSAEEASGSPSRGYFIGGGEPPWRAALPPDDLATLSEYVTRNTGRAAYRRAVALP